MIAYFRKGGKVKLCRMCGSRCLGISGVNLNERSVPEIPSQELKQGLEVPQIGKWAFRNPTREARAKRNFASKFKELQKHWLWPEIDLMKFALRDSAFVHTTPQNILDRLHVLEKAWGRDKLVRALKVDERLMTRGVVCLLNDEKKIKDYILSKFDIHISVEDSVTSLSLFRNSYAHTRKQLDGMSKFLPTWCLKSIIKCPYRRSFQSAYWARTDLKKMKEIVNFLAYSVLQPTLKGAALQATHIMVTQEPGLLSINPALLRNRFKELDTFWEHDVELADIICADPRIFTMKSDKLISKWKMVQSWAQAYPHWNFQLETLGAFSLAGLMQTSANRVHRLEYLATYSLGQNRSIYRVMKCGEASFHSLHPGFKHWHSLVKEGLQYHTDEEEALIGLFEFISKYDRTRPFRCRS